MNKQPKTNPASELTDGELLQELEWRILVGQIPLYAENSDQGRYIEGIGYKEDWGMDGAMSLVALRKIVELGKKDYLVYQELVSTWWRSGLKDYDELIKQLKKKRKRKDYSEILKENKLEPYYPGSRKN